MDNLERKIFILEHIKASVIGSSVQDKEIATKEFLSNYPDYTMYEVCRAIGLNKGTFYHYIHDKVAKKQNIINDELISKEISKIFTETGGKIGKQKILTLLQNNGYRTSKKKVSELMKKMGLVVVYAKRNKRKITYTTTRQYYRNKLNRNFSQKEPNKVWVSDFTEIKILGVKFTLCVILDLFSRKVIAWRIAPKKGKYLIINTFKDAYVSRGEPKGLMFHSDQGAEFTSFEFKSTLRTLGITQSFSNPANPYDNAVVESFFSSFKREEIYRNDYKNYDELKQSVSNYMEFYNGKRPHKTLNYKTPNQYEFGYLQVNKNGI